MSENPLRHYPPPEPPLALPPLHSLISRDELGRTPEGYVAPLSWGPAEYETFLQEQGVIERAQNPRTSSGERLALLSGGTSTTKDAFRTIKNTRRIV